MTKKQEIKKLLELPNDELLILVGNDLRGKASAPIPRKQLILLAKDWYKSKNNELSKIICKSEKVKVIANTDEDPGDIVLLVSSIADLIVAVLGGVSAVTVATLIVREGLIKYCKNYWK